MQLERRNGGPAVAVNMERRESSRFPLQEEVRYRIIHPKPTYAQSSGKSLDISSGGILFTTQEPLPVGRVVEIAVNWPARLDGTCPLQFVATGRVVRSEAARAAVRIERYEFKTRAIASAAAAT
jgi:c-di-GMP-binding flagellar brake protein YcgR